MPVKRKKWKRSRKLSSAEMLKHNFKIIKKTMKRIHAKCPLCHHQKVFEKTNHEIFTLLTARN